MVDQVELVERVASDIVRDVAELPGDTSPDDPRAMIVTDDELMLICERNLATALEASHHAELVEAAQEALLLLTGARRRSGKGPTNAEALLRLALAKVRTPTTPERSDET